MIFAYGYGCCVFKHIYGDRPEILEEMLDSTDPLPPEFFVNLRCPLVQEAVETTTIEVPLNEEVKESVEIASVEDHVRL